MVKLPSIPQIDRKTCFPAAGTGYRSGKCDIHTPNRGFLEAVPVTQKFNNIRKQSVKYLVHDSEVVVLCGIIISPRLAIHSHFADRLVIAQPERRYSLQDVTPNVAKQRMLPPALRWRILPSYVPLCAATKRERVRR